mmetsp:Transcript_45316/g.124779  ORF Transcript_45316/g.124779 Transcript_45316/m.124779 type:complete len:214 (+) Transcript_45316:3067-3708(+)
MVAGRCWRRLGRVKARPVRLVWVEPHCDRRVRVRVGALGNHTTRVGRVVHVPAPFPVVLSIRDRALQVHRELGAPRLARLALGDAVQVQTLQLRGFVLMPHLARRRLRGTGREEGRDKGLNWHHARVVGVELGHDGRHVRLRMRKIARLEHTLQLRRGHLRQAERVALAHGRYDIFMVGGVARQGKPVCSHRLHRDLELCSTPRSGSQNSRTD